MLKATHVNGGWTVMLSSIILTWGFASVFTLFYGILSLIDDSDHHAWSTTKALWFRLPGAKHRGYSHTLLFNLLLGYAIYALFKHFYSTLEGMDLYILMGISLSHIAYDFFTKRKVPLFAPSPFFVIPFLAYIYHKAINGGIDVNDFQIFDAYVIGGLAVWATILEKFILVGKLGWISEFCNKDVGIPLFTTNSPMEKIFTFLNSFVNLGLLAYVIWKFVIPGTLIVPQYDTKLILIALWFNIYVSYLLFSDEVKFFGKNLSDTMRSIFTTFWHIALNIFVVWGLVYLNQKFGLVDFNTIATNLNLAVSISWDILMYGICALAMSPSIMSAFNNMENAWFKVAAATNIVIMVSVFGFYLYPIVSSYVIKLL